MEGILIIDINPSVQYTKDLCTGTREKLFRKPMIKKFVIAYVLLSSPTSGFADTIAHSIGNIFGEFGAGVGASVTNTIASQQPQWITISPKSKEECIAESGKVINSVYIRCRNGRQEFARFDANGKKIVLSERPIPMN